MKIPFRHKVCGPVAVGVVGNHMVRHAYEEAHLIIHDILTHAGLAIYVFGGIVVVVVFVVFHTVRKNKVTTEDNSEPIK